MKQGYLLLLVAVVLYVVFYYKREEPSQREIQDLSYVDGQGSNLLKGSVFNDFKSLSYPQISHGFKQLSHGELPQPLQEVVNSVGPSFTRVRHLDTPETMVPTRRYLPDYYRKDTMGGNDHSSERRPFVDDKSESESAWTDANVSEHPAYYNSQLKHDGFTDIGSFFDKNNQYHDTNSSNTYSLPSDTCYKTKEGNTFCLDNTRLQVTPPQLITDTQDNYALNTIGMHKDYNRIPVKRNREIQSRQYGGVGPSTNSYPDQPLQPHYGSCQV